METTIENPKKPALINGLIWSAINLALFLVTYYVMPDMMGSYAWAGVQMLIGIGLAVYFCMDLRKKVGGYWTFKQALSGIFLMFFVQALVVYFFTMLFAKIEPGYIPKMKEITVTATTQMMEKMGMAQDKVDEAVVTAEGNIDKQFAPGFMDLIKGIALVAVMYFIGALIFAAIFKKDPPMMVPAEE